MPLDWWAACRKARMLLFPRHRCQMDLCIDIEFQGGLLLVTVSGTLAFKMALRLLKQVCDAAVEKQADRILVNMLAVDGDLTTTERYHLGVEVAAYLRQRKVSPKIAFAGKPPAADGFGVRVSQNRGVLTEMFSSEQEALNWLSK